MTLIRVRTVDGSRPVVLGANGAVATFGTSTLADVVLKDAQGQSPTHVSRQAGRFALSNGEAYVENLSEKHALTYRQWGYGHDLALPPRRNGARRVHTLQPGMWWLKNGESLSESGVMREPADGQVCWLLVEVVQNGRASSSASDDLASAGTGTIPLPASSTRQEAMQLQSAQLMACVHIFHDFMAFPPRVEPATRSNATVQRAIGRDVSQRRSEVRNIAQTYGFGGDAVDAQLLTWLLRKQYLTFEQVHRTVAARETLGIPRDLWGRQ